MPFSERVIWLTGASSGIGEALAIELSKKGAFLVLSARREELLENVRSQCDRPDDHLIVAMDVADDDAHETAKTIIVERFGRIDLLIANAAVDQRSLVSNTSIAVERRIMEVNYFGVLKGIHTVLPLMKGQNSGQIVVVTSVMGYVATPLHSSYAASKHALHGYLESLRAELFKTQIDVTILCPGYVRTEISIHALLADGREYGKMDRTHAQAMTSEQFARKAVRAIDRRSPEISIGGPETYVIGLRRFFPRLVRFFMPRLYYRVTGGRSR